MTHSDFCNTSTTSGSFSDSCYDFNNYADAYVDGCGYSDSNPPLCPGATEGDIYVDNSACYHDVAHSNVPFDNTTHSNVAFDNTTHSNVPFDNTTHSNWTDFGNTAHSNTAFGDYHINTSHSNSCSGFNNAFLASYSYTCPSGYYCDWSNYPNPVQAVYVIHAHGSGYNDHSNAPHSNVAFDDSTHSNWTDFGNVSHSDWSDFGNVSHSDWSDFGNVSHSDIAFCDFCNHTDTN